MPNWCNHYIVVKGKLSELKKFREFAKGENGNLDMNSFIPYPEKFAKKDREVVGYYEKIKSLEKKSEKDKKAKKELEQLKMLEKLEDRETTDGYNSGGYNWCIVNWGTKWNFWGNTNEDIKIKNGRLNYSIETAWSFPEPIAIEMSKQFPNLEFEWASEEESREFNVIYKGGSQISYEDMPYEDDEE